MADDAGASEPTQAEEIESGITETAVDIRVADLTGKEVLLICERLDARGIGAKVEEVDLGNNAIAGGKELAELLKRTPRAADVDFRVNKIGKQGAFELQGALMGLRHLTSLALGTCELWDYGAEVVCNAASGMKSLRTLRLEDNYLSSKSGPHIAALIRKNTALEELFVDYNKLRDDGLRPIMEALPRNTRLRWLGVNDNGVTCEGCDAVQSFLEASRGGLKKLDLSVNAIGVKGSIMISKGLAANKTLELLDLGANDPMGDDGAMAVTAALRTNTTLRTLDLTNLHLTDECADMIVANIRNNTTITNIPLLLNEELSMANKERIYRIFVDNRSRPPPRTALFPGGRASLFVLLALIALAAALLAPGGALSPLSLD